MKAGYNSPRVVKKLKDSDTVVVKSSAVYGMRQIRCPRCTNLAAPTTTASGKPIYRCTSCHTEFTSSRM
jgi:transposase-like protein